MRNAYSYFDNVSSLRLKSDATWLAEGLMQRFGDFRSTVLTRKYIVPGERKVETRRATIPRAPPLALFADFMPKLSGIVAAFGPASHKKTAELIYSTRLPLRS